MISVRNGDPQIPQTLEELTVSSKSSIKSLSELEMIRAAKIIIANSNPLLYSKASIESIRDNLKKKGFISNIDDQLNELDALNYSKKNINYIKYLPTNAEGWHQLLMEDEPSSEYKTEVIDKLAEEYKKI